MWYDARFEVGALHQAWFLQDYARTPLHWACAYDRIPIVQYLFTKHADINAIDKVRCVVLYGLRLLA